MSDELDLGSETGATPPADPVDPFADVPADEGAPAEPAEGTLGGDGATLDELEEQPLNAEPQPGDFLEDPEAEPAEPEAEPAAEEGAQPPVEPVETIEGAAAAQESESEPESEPAPEAKSKPASGDAEPAKKSGSSTRHYAILMKNPDTGEWSEPFAEEGGIEAANGEIALREAYGRLVPGDSEEQIELVCFPTHYWKPKKVGAKAKVRRSVTIE